LKIFSRISPQRFSFGLSSGEYGGRKSSVWEREAAAAMVGGAVENQEDILPGKLSRQDVQEGLEARRIRSRNDKIDASPVLRRDRAVQIDVFANELGGDLGPGANRGPAVVAG
jgi:hypothetical protein